MGLINRVVAGAELMDATMEMAERIAAQSEPAVRWIKRVTYMNLDSSFEQALNLEAMAEGILIETPEFKAGLEAFLAKRGSSPRGS
jgi:enoyl-CoA hydratase/carnithine racemase